VSVLVLENGIVKDSVTADSLIMSVLTEPLEIVMGLLINVSTVPG